MPGNLKEISLMRKKEERSKRNEGNGASYVLKSRDITPFKDGFPAHAIRMRSVSDRRKGASAYLHS